MSKACLKSTTLPSGGLLYDAVKRLLDIVAGSILLIIVSPVLLFVAIWIRRTSPGAVLYRQVRVGRNCQPFHVYKFRTMTVDADQCGPLITSSDDTRITPVGRFLRTTKLDELPQLLNVIKGEMSLVGPRPQVPRFVEHFEPSHQEIILAVRPGITGPTQLEFRDEESRLEGVEDREGYYISQLLPIKCEMDIDYVSRRSLGYDTQVLLKTTVIFLRSMCRRIWQSRQQPVFELALAAQFREEAKEDIRDAKVTR